MSDADPYPPLDVKRLTGDEPIKADGAAGDKRLVDFWAWSTSDLVNNSTRGVLAEYLVAIALGVADGVRVPWGAYDIVTPTGIRVEVKSSSRWQSWYQRAPSSLQFGIRPTREWSKDTNELARDVKRQAAVYVFAVLHSEQKQDLDPLDCDRWEFYVLAAAVLDERFGGQKAVSLKALQGAGATRVTHRELSAAVEMAGRGR